MSGVPGRFTTKDRESPLVRHGYLGGPRRLETSLGFAGWSGRKRVVDRQISFGIIEGASFEGNKVTGGRPSHRGLESQDSIWIPPSVTRLTGRLLRVQTPLCTPSEPAEHSAEDTPASLVIFIRGTRIVSDAQDVTFCMWYNEPGMGQPISRVNVESRTASAHRVIGDCRGNG